jgi:hypothetical protein
MVAAFTRAAGRSTWSLGVAMPTFDPLRYQEATVVFKRGLKASNAGIHRTLNRSPKGKGWVQCNNAPEGILCRPAKVRESIAYFKTAYEIFPDIVALNQIASGHELLGETQEARTYFTRMKEQAEQEGNEPYRKVAELGLYRLG